MTSPPNRRGAPRKGYVYFIGARGDGPIKIGASTNPLVRLAGIRNGSPEDLSILAVIPTDDCISEERRVQALFASQRIRGEWFQRSAELMQLISEFADSPFMMPVSTTRSGTVRADHRGRVSLAKMGVNPGDVFLMDVGSDGSIVLIPATMVPIGTLGFNDSTAD